MRVFWIYIVFFCLPPVVRAMDMVAIPQQPIAFGATEVTWTQWTRVRDWAWEQGYRIAPGAGETNLPVQAISWYDAVKWCNALSEWTGRTPAYYTDTAHSTVYRRDEHDLTPAHVKWDADGFRLPTEKEWEYACRAGSTTRFYWGDYPRTHPVNDLYAVYHHWGQTDVDGVPHPVASKQPNPFALYDMSGNVAEWCWDWWSGDASDAPHGPDTGHFRILRGGGVGMDRTFACGDRHFTHPFYVPFDAGLRVASASNQSVDTWPTTSQPAPDLDTDDTPSRFNMPDGWAARFLARLDEWLPSSQRLPRDPAVTDYWNALKKKAQPVEFFPADPSKNRDWLHDIRHLAGAVTATRNASDLMVLTFAMESYARDHKRAFDRLTMKQRQTRATPDGGPYWFDRSIGMGAGRGLPWLQLLVDLHRAGISLPPETMEQIALMVLEQHIGLGLLDTRAQIPNQHHGNAAHLLLFANLYRDVEISDALFEAGRHRMNLALQSVMPDGSDIEYALSYNWGLIHKLDMAIRALAAFDPDAPEFAPWRTLRHNTMRLYAGLVMPTGAVPVVGNMIYQPERTQQRLDSWAKEERLPNVIAVADALIRGKGTGPDYQSIAFPYAGYYVLRDGWSATNNYLFLKSSRPGAGQGRAQENSIQLVAAGRPQLVERPRSRQPEWHLAVNTVWVDGRPPARVLKVDAVKGYDTPRSLRWFTGEFFDYCEGRFEGPYRDETGETMASHFRQFVFFKPWSLWIVTDTVTGGVMRQQRWRFDDDATLLLHHRAAIPLDIPDTKNASWSGTDPLITVMTVDTNLTVTGTDGARVTIERPDGRLLFTAGSGHPSSLTLQWQAKGIEHHWILATNEDTWNDKTFTKTEKQE